MVLAITLPAAREREHHAIDYLGTALLAVGLASLVLLTTLGGTTYDWGSPFIVGLGVLAIAALSRLRLRRAPRRRAGAAAAAVRATRSSG